MSHRHSAFLVLFLLVAAAVPASSQVRRRSDPSSDDIRSTRLMVTASVSKDHIRLTALALTQRIRLEVLSVTGEPLFNSDFRPGNRLEWYLRDQQGSELRDGVYGCVVTVEDLNAQVSRRRAILRFRDGAVSFDALNRDTSALDEQENLTILSAEEPAPFTFVSHDGTEGWVESASGGLSFNAGSLSRIRDSVPQLRLTPEGNLGIGVQEPQVKLDVSGLIRASEGFQFSDGTILKMEGGLPILVNERSFGTEGIQAGAEGKTTRALAAGGSGSVFFAGGGSPGKVLGSEGGSPNFNTTYGVNAGPALTTGWDNSFFGAAAGYKNATGLANSFFGFYAGFNTNGGSNWEGSLNAYFGYKAGMGNTTGMVNSFFGEEAGSLNTTGGYNTFVGSAAGFYNTTGSRNTFLGKDAGYKPGDGNTVESNNTLVGASTLGFAGITNATALGYQARVTQSNSLVLGSIYGINGASADTKVGIGTTAPDRKLQIASSPGMNAELHIGGAGDEAKDVFSGMGVDLSAGPSFNFGYSGFSFGRSSGFINVRPDASAVYPNPSLRFMTSNVQRMIVTANGKVGIGTTDPLEALHVIGNFRVSGLIYSGAADIPVPDYVFEQDYRLMPVADLEKYLVNEKHLPNIPSAAEIREKGLNLSDFQMKLLEKIEELTLYIIKQQGTIQEQQDVIADHKANEIKRDALNRVLEARLAALEKMLAKQLN